MKIIVAVFVLCLPFYVFGADASVGVAKGDTFDQVIQKLGAPKGQVKGGMRTTYYYDRGMVDFRTGRVERVFLVTDQEAKDRIAVREKVEADMRQQAEAEHVRLKVAGKAQLEKILADKTFAASPPVVRLAYWADFQKQYPEIDVSTPIAEAKKAQKSAQDENGRVSELLALNNRASEIDARFKQLDEDYAVSLANWKRTEIDEERAKLTEELAALKARLEALLK